MSVVVWDGKTLAADRACFRSGVVTEMSKMESNDDFVAGFVGRVGPGRALARWAINGRKPEEYDDEWRENEVILVDRRTGEAWVYDGQWMGHTLPAHAAIGETAASAAALALVIAGHDARDAVDLLVKCGRFDGVGFGSDAVEIADAVRFKPY